MALSDLILLALSFGALSSWKENSGYAPDQSFGDMEIVPQSRLEPKSLYDLMKHFPLDKGMECPTSDARFRYPGECTRYITCRNFQAHIRSCPPGMMFDSKYNHCRLGFEVDCDDDTPPQFECGTDEVYTTCGTSCERTCDNLYRQIECESDCVEGCRCRMGYVRNIAGKCVKPQDCDTANSMHSIFKDQ